MSTATVDEVRERRVSFVRLVPSPRDSPRGPFVTLVLLLAGGGLIALLVLNTAIAAASFEEQALQNTLSDLSDTQQALEQEVTAKEAPAALAAAATELGMVPSGKPGYLVLRPDGSYVFIGTPEPAGVGQNAGPN